MTNKDIHISIQILESISNDMIESVVSDDTNTTREQNAIIAKLYFKHKRAVREALDLMGVEFDIP